MSHDNPILRGGGMHHTAVAARDFDRSVTFYRDVLGCRPKARWGEPPDRAVMLEVGGGAYVEVFERPGSASAAAEARLLHLCLRCENLDEVVARVRKAGATITVEPKDVDIHNQAEGEPATIAVRLAFFTGPDGEIIELMQCPDL